MESISRSPVGPDKAPPHYGDFPALFHDLPPDEPIDFEQRSVLARILTQAEPDTTLEIVDPEVLRRMLPTLSVPEHVWLFWAMVLELSERRVRPRQPPIRRARMGPAETLHPEAPLDSAGRRIPRHGDYPGLFWDCRPNEPVDFDQPHVVARVLMEGAPETVWELISLEVLERLLPDLPVPESTRSFWYLVLHARRQVTTGIHESDPI
jgi:hypothetical protein